jgi:hypothetical protein
MPTNEYSPKLQDPAHLRIGTLLTALVAQVVKVMPSDNQSPGMDITIHPDGEYHVAEGKGYDMYEVQPGADNWLEQVKEVLAYAESQADYNIKCSMPDNFTFKEACTIKLAITDIRKALCF